MVDYDKEHVADVDGEEDGDVPEVVHVGVEVCVVDDVEPLPEEVLHVNDFEGDQ